MKDELYNLADDILSDIELEPDWEKDCGDVFAAFYPAGTMGSDLCVVILQNNLNGDIDNVKLFETEEEAEDFVNALQAHTYADEEEEVND